MQKRRDVLISISGIMTLAGCTGGSPEETPDEAIEADVQDVIVTLDDLESGWSGGLDDENEGEATFFNDNVTIEIKVDKLSNVTQAESTFDELESDETESTSSDSIDYGNEGFLVNPMDGYVVLGFRAGNLVIRISSATVEGSFTDPENPARDFADKIVEKIAAQSN